MNSITQNVLLPIDIEKRKKIEMNVKVFALILLSNILTYLLTCPRSAPQTVNTKVDRPEALILRLPLKTFFFIPDNSEVLATILDKSNHVIFKKVYLRNLKSIDQRNDLDYLNEQNSGDIKKYEVEITQNEYSKLKNLQTLELSAIPYQANLSDSTSHQRRTLEFTF